ncbi:hypothetical protein CANTEDRAFT_115687 [Yamadazyma tenuis ATCC 10573]|uniref:Uncharacterized protein n=1 Tax=Candida tenuis (strain ATCC 10573 / BCRC 21748 / CBS 615 / JCM 9827 / NBRC 10315 / NRRL Y-1498 / VKM Y-70) TaxID=590646 RepID=G3BBS1_CANTC|nr:uncharacterized protein CANTEDRAFT_115687 [Yamadazyma tenuis ATCC 10573]EGV62223.1 hypothetical protein CANTEDRAFT_115687 [Yamadazyma tenuis ATCC 10573]
MLPPGVILVFVLVFLAFCAVVGQKIQPKILSVFQSGKAFRHCCSNHCYLSTVS